MMLLARAYQLLFQHHDVASGVFDLAPSLREEIPMVSLRILMHLLRDQETNGSWDGVCEVTSYGILALASLAKLPWIQQLDQGRIIATMALGKSFLHSNRGEWGRGHYLWIEKVTYSSGVLSEAYCLAAALAPIPSTVHPDAAVPSSSRSHLIADGLLLGMRKTGNLLARTPMFCKTDPWTLRIAEMQACFAMQALQRQPPNVFPRTAKGSDKYIFLIPLALTVCAEAHGCSVSLSVLYEMMLLSIMNFHADEYMEGVVEIYFAESLDSVRSLVRQIFRDLHTSAQVGLSNVLEEGAKMTSQNLEGPVTDPDKRNPVPGKQAGYDAPEDRLSTGDVRAVLDRFVTRILRHPAVLSSPASLQTQLVFELQIYLLAHITHAQDNQRLRKQWQDNGDQTPHTSGGDTSAGEEGLPTTQYREPGRSFYHWVRSTSADHTSCPFSFIFFNCLVHAAASSDTSQTKHGGIHASARTAYVAEDACRHLASLCRMYNDIGSMARDADERALNSVNFPEFFYRVAGTASATTAAPEAMPESAKADLFWIAEYERRGLETAMKSLEEELGRGELAGALRLFVDVTDLYGQIYVLEDVGTRTR